MKSWVEVSGRRLAANYGVLTAAAGAGTGVLAVVKANAYGHGAALCAGVLSRAGAEWLGVTDAAEGAAVRRALLGSGVRQEDQPRILVMCGMLEEDAEVVVRSALTPVVWSVQQVEWLAEAADRCRSSTLGVHVEVDSGMARQGAVVGEELRSLLGWIRGQSRLVLDGVMTHFASAEIAGSPLTLKQQERFEEAMREVAEEGLRPSWMHAGNSSTIDNEADVETCSLTWLRELAAQYGAKAMVRSGLGLYGYCLPIEGADSSVDGLEHRVRDGLLPVMTWKARVIGLRNVGPGDAVGYNGSYVAKREMRLALLPIGYADGLRRELSGSDSVSGGWTMVRGRRAEIVGRVSMNLTVVDVSDIPEVAVGEEVVILGDGVTAEDHARLAGTIAYEVVCGVRAESRLVDTAE